MLGKSSLDMFSSLYITFEILILTQWWWVFLTWLIWFNWRWYTQESGTRNLHKYPEHVCHSCFLAQVSDAIFSSMLHPYNSFYELLVASIRTSGKDIWSVETYWSFKCGCAGSSELDWRLLTAVGRLEYTMAGRMCLIRRKFSWSWVLMLEDLVHWSVDTTVLHQPALLSQSLVLIYWLHLYI